jgi:hypothetical protein
MSVPVGSSDHGGFGFERPQELDEQLHGSLSSVSRRSA